ncbi:DNA translocase FtsK [Halobacillus karajensis]|uniref:DNA translocase FtsK n=1 Tax=Halobacillus karajensis TaxID=195088 RepID=UPI0008A73DC9|nr:DNA translocase FtsK [Halobacillus karajensis]SEI06539.1 DNA translocase FtsK [Halobacillus karajensis]
MWKDFKNKMKRLFDSEENSEQQTLHNNKEEKHEVNAKTKMTYRYPKQGEFRFPVIPDGPGGSQSESYQRERPRRKKPVENDPPQDRFFQREKRTKDKKEAQELPETSSVPFTPTDVPSPIYGYQNRQLTKGLQNLEYAVEEQQSQPEFFTDSNDEKQWQDLRKRMRARVDEESSKPASTPEIHELGDHELAEQEKAATEEATWTNKNETDLKFDVEGKKEETEKVQGSKSPSSESMEPAEDEGIAFEESSVKKSTEESEFILGDEPASKVETENNLDRKEQPSTEEYIADEWESEISSEGENSKEELVSEESSSQMDVSEESSDEPSLVTYSEEESSSELEHTEESFFESEEEMREDQASSQNENAINEAEMYQQEQVEKPKKDEKPHTDNQGEVESTSQAEKKTPKKEGRKRSVPFNVLMTPRDKRNRDHIKKQSVEEEQHSEDKQETLKTESQEDLSERVEYQTPLHLLEDPVRRSSEDDSWTTEQMELLETTLRHFHVRAKVVNAMKGPTVTRFEVQPEPGVKVSKITNLTDDIKLSMAAKDIRIEAPIPGKQAIGIEVPNHQSTMVGLQEIFESEAFMDDPSPLSVGLGLDIGGESIVTNLKKMPHGLIAGATGSGKSVCINTILVSLLYKAHHEDVKFLLIDPKMVELAPYNELPHLVSPVITDVKAATTALKWAVKEMEERYEKFVEEGVRDVERYNEKMMKQNRRSEKLPYLVIVIDELADLMMVSPQDVEDAICRIAQKARACGIHLLLATQRPSVDVITGLIKANIPTRIAFSVSSQVDSRTIIDSGGAEKLLGKGDMLFVENGSGQPVRIQGAFVSDNEIERVTNYVKKIAPPQYLFHQEELMKQVSTEEETDELFDEAVDFVIDQNGASASLIQRRFKVGYNRAARLIDQMEAYGIISEQKGSKPRDILLTKQQIDEMME